VTITTPFKDALPPLSTEERELLRLSIEREGVRNACLATEDGRLLDGHNRREIDPGAPVALIPGSAGWSDEECLAFVWRCNRERRNLSPDQKRDVRRKEIATAARLRKQDPKRWTESALAQVFGVTQQCVSGWLRPITFTTSCNGYNRTASDDRRPDARAKLNRAAQEDILFRVRAGESQAQVAADYGITQPTVSKTVNRLGAKAVALATTAAAADRVPEGADFRVGDFYAASRSIADASIQLIFTDPPYFSDCLPLYRRLAEVAARVLTPGGSLVTYVGHRLLPSVLEEIRSQPGLTFYWPLACLHTGALARMPRTGQVVTWKPLLWFIRGKERYDPAVLVEDSVRSERQKGEHAWQQGIPEAAYYIGKLTTEGGSVFDPFCGGGTTAVAAKRLGRRVITCDVDAAALARARNRYDNASEV
jgi:site-specific DNA-methyltransferase (adenine-specific)